MTLFKIPHAEDQDKLLEMYKAMPQKALKVSTGRALSHCFGLFISRPLLSPRKATFPFKKLTAASTSTF